MSATDTNVTACPHMAICNGSSKARKRASPSHLLCAALTTHNILFRFHSIQKRVYSSDRWTSWSCTWVLPKCIILMWNRNLQHKMHCKVVDLQMSDKLDGFQSFWFWIPIFWSKNYSFLSKFSSSWFFTLLYFNFRVTGKFLSKTVLDGNRFLRGCRFLFQIENF